MDRRHFLKTGIGLGSTLLVGKVPLEAFSWPIETNPDKPKAYTAGEPISPEAFVLNQELEQKTLVAICRERRDAVVNMLYIFGGGALEREDKLGGIWCADSFEDLHVVRFLNEKYKFSGLHIVPVAPVYSRQYYGLDERVYLDAPDDSEKFKVAARKFIDSTQAAADAGIIPVQPYFDLRLRLLLNREQELMPGEGYGAIYPWQSRFRADDETQKYGVPTVWLLDAAGVVLEGPFHGNVYHSDPYELGYTAVDLDQALQKYL